MTTTKKKIIRVCCFLFSLPLFAKIKFANETINDSDEILCTVSDMRSGFEKSVSPLYAKIKNGNACHIFMISPAPGSLELLQKNEIVQVRNRFGTFRFSLCGKKVLQQESLSALSNAPLGIFPLAVSPDGKWFCSFEKNNFLEANLFLENVLTKEKFTIDEHARLSYAEVPVKWSGDSSRFVYEKNGSLYFASPDALSRGVEIAESYRKLGRTSAGAASFCGNTLFFIQDGIVFSADTKEFYARTLYNAVIGSGVPLGCLPDGFEDATDGFSVSMDGKHLCVVKNKKYVSSYDLKKNTAEKLYPEFLLPYINRKEAVLDADVFYGADGKAFSVFTVFPYSEKNEQTVLYSPENNFTELVRFETNQKPVLSPEKKSILFFGKAGALVFDLETKEIAKRFSDEKILHALWKNENEVLLLGNEALYRWNIKENLQTPLFPTNAESCFWKNEKALIKTQSGKFFSFDIDNKSFEALSIAEEETREVQSERYRIFLRNARNPLFENTLSVRMLWGSAKTFSLFSDAESKKAKAKKTALLFDAVDNPETALLLLSKLKAKNIPATFFINGNFIVRYPNETKQIANADVLCASLFFAPLDFLSGEFSIDENFVRRGLARNEDEFFALTGKELHPLWHAPFYHANDVIREAGKKAGYEYADAKTVPSLLETYNDFRESNNELTLVSLNGITEQKPLSKIGGDFDVLINAMLERGAEFVLLSDEL